MCCGGDRGCKHRHIAGVGSALLWRAAHLPLLPASQPPCLASETPARLSPCCCSQVRFVYDGNRLNPTDTPNSLEMEDGDAIDAFLEQIGGGGSHAGCGSGSALC